MLLYRNANEYFHRNISDYDPVDINQFSISLQIHFSIPNDL